MATPLKGWRKIANAVWHAANDPQIYGSLEIDATQLLELVALARSRGEHVTPTHVVGRAIAHALAAVPDLNVRIVRDRAIPRGSIDVFFITSVGRGRDLTGVKVEHMDEKGVTEVARELDARSRRMKSGDDPDLARTKQVMERLPRPILHVALRLSAWISQDLALGIPALGLAASPFGSAMVSSVGMLGLPMGFAPLSWLYRVPVLILVGEISDRAVVRSGRVEVRPMLPIAATIDHRYADGAHLSEALRAFREYLEAPAAFEPMLSSEHALEAS